tara:strand:+ start:104 stop:475 length:372 start_codon:yes stop_codon:yes gene_type:complete
MQNIINFIQANMNFLNDIKAYHWQTKSYSEHENLQEFYEKFDELNDRFVETWQGKTHQRINFSAELRPGIMNYADNKQVCSEVCKTSDRINEIYKEVDGPDLHSILEDMIEQTSQLCFHLTLK